METLDLELVAETPRLGKDELNLCEFPFALLHSRPPKNAPLTLEFRDGDKEWTVEGSSAFGLPMAPDIGVYVVLMEITREQDFPVQVEFCRRDLIMRLGWDPNGRSYERLALSLDRLVGVTIRTKNAFFDARNRRWTSKEAFHILERYKIMDGTLPGQSQASLFPSWIRWSPELYANLQAGYIKTLDVSLFLSLKSSISQALYRYLDKKRYDGKPIYRIALKTLAFEHLGMSRTYFPSEAKHKLKPAHEELMAVGFLERVEYAPTKDGEMMVIYGFPPLALKAAADTSVMEPPRPGAKARPVVSELAQRLIDAGVTRAIALRLADQVPEECERQLLYLPYQERVRKPGAFLTSAIEGAWAAPAAYTEVQTKTKRAETIRKKQEAKQTQATQAAEERSTAENAFASWWEAQSEAQRAVWIAEAQALLRVENQTLAELGQKYPDGVMYREGLRVYLKRVSGYQPA